MLNGLPLSTITSTPQLLHTRTVLKLPPSVRPPSPPPPPEEIREKELAKAAKRLHLVTKEQDWRVAKAYVAIAEMDSDGDDQKSEKPVLVSTARGLHNRAVDAYMEDDSWESNMRKGGYEARLSGFPYFGDRGQAPKKN